MTITITPKKTMLKRGRSVKGPIEYKAARKPSSMSITKYSSPIPKSVSTTGQVFPDKFKTTLSYNYIYSYTAIGTRTYVQLRANGPYDPLVAAGGGQPMGYDQLSTLYQQYRVSKATVVAKFVNQASTAAYVCIYPLSSTSTPISLEEDLEQRYGTNTVVSGVAGGGVATLTNTVDVAKLYGGMLGQDHNAAVSGVPVMQAIFNVTMTDCTGGTMSMYYNLRITYEVEFFDPVRLGTS